MEGSQIIFNNMHLPFLIYFLLLIPSLNSEFSADFIGDLNHYSIAYNSKLASDQQQLDAIFEEAPERIVSLKTADLEDYTCILPVAENKGQKKIDEYKGPTPFELLKPLADDRDISIYGGSGYWFYDIAHGRYIRQYHDNRDTKETTEYLLGTYRHDQSVEDAKKFNQLHPPKTKINNIEYPYFPVHYRHGTPCDLTGKPRETTLLYICYEYSRHMIHSITEVSSCKYEISVLTNLLCSHPSFDMPTTPDQEIRCFTSAENDNPKPRNLQTIEQQNFAETYVQYSMTSDSSVNPRSSVFSKLINSGDDRVIKRLDKNTLTVEVDEVEDVKTVIDQMKEVAGLYKKLREAGIDPHPSKMAKFEKGFTEDDHKLIDDFWSGKSCFIGGQGYWSYEFCYNNKVSQFHLEGGKRTKENILGEYNADLHRKWLIKNRKKAFVHEEDYLKQVSNFYGNGALCEETGEKRSVEVQLKCRMPGAGESPSIVLFSLEEPETCTYTLLLESALLCEGLQLLDKDGLMDPDADDDVPLLSGDEAIKKIVENIKNNKQYYESLQAEFIVKEVTPEEVEELLNTKSKKQQEVEDKKKKKFMNDKN